MSPPCSFQPLSVPPTIVATGREAMLRIIIGEAMDAAQETHKIALSGCRLGDDGAAILADALLRYSPTIRLTRLDIGHNSIGPLGLAEILAALNQMWTGIKELILPDNRVGHQGAAMIANELKGSNLVSGLIKLDLSRNQIGEDGCNAFAEALPVVTHHCRLGTLLLWGNMLGRDGPNALAAAAGSSPHLEELEIHC